MPGLSPLYRLSFEQFCAKLETEDASYIRHQIEEFIKSFTEACQGELAIRHPSSPSSSPEPAPSSPPRPETPQRDTEETVHERQVRRGREYKRILESFCVVILKDSFWQLKDTTRNEEVSEESNEFLEYAEIVLSHLEAYIVPRIHRYLFVPDKRVDWDFVVRCKEFEWLRPTNLDIPLLPSDLAPVVERCSLHLTNMAFEKIPSSKSHHLTLAWTLLQSCLKHLHAPVAPVPDPSNSSLVPSTNITGYASDMVSMDEILPLLVYIVIKAQPPQLYSDLAYLSAAAREMGTVSAFYIASTQVAVEFIRTMSLKKLSTAKEQALRPGRLAGLFDEPSPSSLTKSTALKAQEAIKDFLSTGKNRVRTTFEMVSDSVQDTVTRVSLLGPISAVAAAVKVPTPKSTPPPIETIAQKEDETENIGAIGEALMVAIAHHSDTPSTSLANGDHGKVASNGVVANGDQKAKEIDPSDFIQLDASDEPLNTEAASKELLVDVPIDNADSEAKEDDWKKEHRFWDANPDLMSKEEIELLLSDYRALIVANRNLRHI